MKNFNNKICNITEIEQNIIVGSLLGDGSLALYGRSKNAYYREHGCDAQIPYRLWKANKLTSLDFKLNLNCKYAKLCSPSTPLFTKLHQMFYINGIKTITKSNIKLLTHPIGLACFYMDDGSLVMDSTKRKNGSVYIFPRISLYTLNFSEDENIVIRDYLKYKFGVNLKLKYRKDGKNTILEINKRNDLLNFINIVKPYVNEVPCMKYKVNLEENFNLKKLSLEKLGYKNINTWKEEIIDNSYTKEEELLILQFKKERLSDLQIAKRLNRSYWGIVDKLRRLNNPVLSKIYTE